MTQNGNFIILERLTKTASLLHSDLKEQRKKVLKTNKFWLVLILCTLSFHTVLKSQNNEYSSLNDSTSLVEIFNKADQIESVRSLLIQQGGGLVGEQYFEGRSPNRPFNIKSASKSIIGLLVGIAIEEGFIPSVDEPISRYFPEYFETNPDPKKEAITVQNLLTMQTGLKSTSSGNYGAWVISDNWVEFALRQDFVSQIGGGMVYSTGTSHLLSVIVSKASGVNTKRFAERYLFDPLNIVVGGWERDPQGNYMGGNNLALKPSDMLKIGQMLLDDGRYESQQIISKKWIVDSFKTYTYSNYNPYGYGYQWWNKRTAGYTSLFAWGHGGQYILMIPELDAVLVITSSVTQSSARRTYKTPIFNLIEREIIPFLEERTGKKS